MVNQTQNQTRTVAETKAARDWQHADVFLREHPQIKKFLWDAADKEVAAKRRFSFFRLVENARWKVWADKDGKDVKINNTYIPAFARMYAKEHPEAMDFIEFRNSRFDKIV